MIKIGRVVISVMENLLGTEQDQTSQTRQI